MSHTSVDEQRRVCKLVEDLEEARAWRDLALIEAEALGVAAVLRSEQPVEAAQIYGSLGQCAFSLGKYDRAIQMVEEMRAVMEAAGHRQGQVAAAGNLGFILSALGQHDRAAQVQEETLNILEELGDREGQGAAHLNLGNAFLRQARAGANDKFAKAIEQLEKARSVMGELGNVAAQGKACSSLGICYQSLQRYGEAVGALDQAMAIASAAGNRTGHASAMGNLGICYDNMGQHEKAISLHRAAIEIDEEVGDIAHLARNHNNLAAALIRCDRLEEACAALFRSLTLWLKVERDVGAHDDRRVSLFEEIQSVFVTLQRVLLSQGNPGWALGVSSKAKARALSHRQATDSSSADELTDDAPDYQAICGAWWGEVQELSRAEGCHVRIVEFSLVADFLAIWVLSGDGKLLTSATLPSVGLGHDKGSTIKQLLADTRKSMKVRGRDAGDLQAADAVEPGDDTAAQVDADEPRANKCPSCRLRFAECECKSAAREETLLRELYQVLIAPIDEALVGAEEILIIPHKELFEVPWAALLDADGHYMIQRHVIRVAPSLRVARQAAEAVQPGPNGHVVVLGNPQPLPPPFRTLPHAEEEAAKVEETLNKAGILVRDFFKGDRNPRATKDRVKQALQGSGWSHLACHGDLDTDSLVLALPTGLHLGVETLGASRVAAQYSCDACGKLCRTLSSADGPRWKCKDCQDYDLCNRCHRVNEAALAADADVQHGIHEATHVFWKIVDDETNLSMAEVQGSDAVVGIKLAQGSSMVLSACNTGRGEIKAEGVVGLARGFLWAGASCVVVSLWSVDDRSTAALMDHAYGLLVSGVSLPRAIRDSMLHLARLPAIAWLGGGSAGERAEREGDGGEDKEGEGGMQRDEEREGEEEKVDGGQSRSRSQRQRCAEALGADGTPLRGRDSLESAGVGDGGGGGGAASTAAEGGGVSSNSGDARWDVLDGFRRVENGAGERGDGSGVLPAVAAFIDILSGDVVSGSREAPAHPPPSRADHACEDAAERRAYWREFCARDAECKCVIDFPYDDAGANGLNFSRESPDERLLERLYCFEDREDEMHLVAGGKRRRVILKVHTLCKWRERGTQLFKRALRVTSAKVIYAHWNERTHAFEQERGVESLKLLPVAKRLQHHWRNAFRAGRFEEVEWEWRTPGSVPLGEDGTDPDVAQAYEEVRAAIKMGESLFPKGANSGDKALHRYHSVWKETETIYQTNKMLRDGHEVEYEVFLREDKTLGLSESWTRPMHWAGFLVMGATTFLPRDLASSSHERSAEPGNVEATGSDSALGATTKCANECEDADGAEAHATHVCQVCREALCDLCAAEHRRLKKTRQHLLVPLSHC